MKSWPKEQFPGSFPKAVKHHPGKSRELGSQEHLPFSWLSHGQTETAPAASTSPWIEVRCLQAEFTYTLGENKQVTKSISKESHQPAFITNLDWMEPVLLTNHHQTTGDHNRDSGTSSKRMASLCLGS